MRWLRQPHPTAPRTLTPPHSPRCTDLLSSPGVRGVDSGELISCTGDRVESRSRSGRDQVEIGTISGQSWVNVGTGAGWCWCANAGGAPMAAVGRWRWWADEWRVREGWAIGGGRLMGGGRGKEHLSGRPIGWQRRQLREVRGIHASTAVLCWRRQSRCLDEP